MKSSTHQSTLHLSFKIKCCVDRLRPPGQSGKHVLALSFSGFHRQSGSGGGDGLQRCLNPSSRPCANPRRDERGLLAETTVLCCGHTCRMPPVCGRRPSPMLPSLPLCAQAGPAPPRTSGRSSENRDTTGSAVSRLQSKPRIRCRNIDRTQCATNVLRDTDRGDRAWYTFREP